MFLVSVTAQTSPYDPWADLDDDGDIDIYDIVDIAGRYGTSGTAINKTALLLELQTEVASIKTRILQDKTVRFVEENETIVFGPTAWTDAAVFTWEPDNASNNVILSVSYYAQFRVVPPNPSAPTVFSWRVGVGAERNFYRTLTVHGETNFSWTLSHAWVFQGQWANDDNGQQRYYSGGIKPNQPSYEIKFQVESSQGWVYFKDINMIITVADGVPAS